MPRTSAAKNLVLLVLARQVVAVHEQELGAHQAEPHGAVGQRLLDLDRQLDIGFEPDLDPVARHRRQAPQPVKMAPLARHLLLPRLVGARPSPARDRE